MCICMERWRMLRILPSTNCYVLFNISVLTWVEDVLRSILFRIIHGRLSFELLRIPGGERTAQSHG